MNHYQNDTSAANTTDVISDRWQSLKAVQTRNLRLIELIEQQNQKMIEVLNEVNREALALAYREVERVNGQIKLYVADQEAKNRASGAVGHAATQKLENPVPSTETFMFTEIAFDWGTDSPANMLRKPGVDVGLDVVADDWIASVIASDCPDAEFGQLIDNLSGLLNNVELIREHYRQYVDQSQQAAA